MTTYILYYKDKNGQKGWICSVNKEDLYKFIADNELQTKAITVSQSEYEIMEEKIKKYKSLIKKVQRIFKSIIFCDLEDDDEIDEE